MREPVFRPDVSSISRSRRSPVAWCIIALQKLMSAEWTSSLQAAGDASMCNLKPYPLEAGGFIAVRDRLREFVRETAMRFNRTKIDGLWVIEPERIEDPRGSFARTFCKLEFSSHGLSADFAQHSMSVSYRKYTLRGLHFQDPPHAEIKLVTCVRGAIWDVAVDLRSGSPTYLQWMSQILSSSNGAQFYIPEGFAHGFQSLTEDAAVSYLISTPYHAESARGIRYDDPAIGINWPAEPSVLSERDSAWPPLRHEVLLSAEETQV